jgi:AraC-like DNA-binding protein
MAGFGLDAPDSVDIAMVAHPSVTVIVDLGKGEGLTCRGDGAVRHGSVVIGLLPGGLRVSGRGAGGCLQIRLEPAVAAAVLGGPAEFTAGVISLEDVWGREAVRLQEMLRAEVSWQPRFDLAARFLGRRLQGRRRVDPEVAHAWRRTLTSRGRLRVDGLAGEVGWSRKRLWSRFRSQLGISPKRAARLARFDHAAHLLASGRAPAHVAADTGFVDQSHLHREVREFAGLTPAGVAAAPWLAIDDVAWPATRTG